MNKTHEYPFHMHVSWQDPSKVKNLSVQLQDWLLHTGSLTERLQALTHNFEVEVLGQQLSMPDDSECLLLNNALEQSWQIREVILKGVPLDNNQDDKQDWVFARSILPNTLCNSQFANLGNQPLGKRIFNDSNFIRSEFQIGKLQYHPLTHEVLDTDNPLWARRSKFRIEHYELIVAEAFLPDSPCYWSHCV